MIATHLVDELSPVVDEMLAAVKTSSLPVWPGPLPPTHASLWPDPEDVAGFFGVAAGVGSLLYVDLLHVRDVDDDLAADPSELVQITCGFVADGVLLHLSFGLSRIHTEPQVADHLSLIDIEDEDRRIEQYARQVFEDPCFQDHGGAGRDDRCHVVVRDAFPELDEHMVRRVARRAQQLDRQEAKPAREAAMAAEGHERYASGETKVAIATSLGITTSVLNRVMQQNPPA